MRHNLPNSFFNLGVTQLLWFFLLFSIPGLQAATPDSEVVAWGYNDYQQTNVPPALINLKTVVTYNDHNLALTRDGKVIAWGSQNTVPLGLTNIIAIAAGAGQNLAVRSDGTVVEWYPSGAFTNDPLPGLVDVKAVATGDYHRMALKKNGTIVAWGGCG
jgi:alpha-tubulin suppressor-like RCC1 family protein